MDVERQRRTAAQERRREQNRLAQKKSRQRKSEEHNIRTASRHHNNGSNGLLCGAYLHLAAPEHAASASLAVNTSAPDRNTTREVIGPGTPASLSSSPEDHSSHCNTSLDAFGLQTPTSTESLPAYDPAESAQSMSLSWSQNVWHALDSLVYSDSRSSLARHDVQYPQQCGITYPSPPETVQVRHYLLLWSRRQQSNMRQSDSTIQHHTQKCLARLSEKSWLAQCVDGNTATLAVSRTCQMGRMDTALACWHFISPRSEAT